MYILGLHNDEDSGICLVIDGELVEAVSEERFTRVKLYRGFPDLSLQYVLKKYGLRLEDIDHFAYGWYGQQNDWNGYILKQTNRTVEALEADPGCGNIIKSRLQVEIDQDTRTREAFVQHMDGLGIPREKISFIDHHQSHAWAAFSCSPYDEAIVLTFDGRGDLRSATVSYASADAGLVEYDYLLTVDSLGYLYGQVTRYLGFVPHRHEGKVTGLAAHGNPAKTLPLFNRLMCWKNDTIRSELGTYKPFFSGISGELLEELGRYSREDIAAGVQAHCENLVVQYVKFWLSKIDKAHIKNVCLGGGLFANVKINQRVAEIPGVENVFVFPHMGDGGLPVGAACLQYYRLTSKSKMNFPTAYLGPSYTDEEIEESLREFGNRISYEKVVDKVDRAVTDLMSGQVLGYFDGRMEFGPRALGSRSILYHARDRSVNDWLNKRFGRTEFMPFAPVSPVEYAAECYETWKAEDSCTTFMTKTYNCTGEFAKGHGAVVHVDGTARPQVVSAALNGNYYHVVKNYCDRTGERALINTSFNKHEEPIVCTPTDAINSLVDGIIDVLIVGSFRATSKGKSEMRAQGVQ